MTENGRLTDETKASIDEHLTISDFYTFIPKTKDFYNEEAKLFARSVGVELIDFQLSGILQVAGQAMSTYLKGEQFYFNVGSAHVSDVGFNFIGAAVSKNSTSGGTMPTEKL